MKVTEYFKIKMKAKYFSDTDTMLIQFSDREIGETYDLNHCTGHFLGYNSITI
jgi:uncharacterized protein YuzE